MNLLDIQSILSGMSILYGMYDYNGKIVHSLISRAEYMLNGMNSLILTNLMKSWVSLRVYQPSFFNKIVQIIKSRPESFDIVALSYTLARLVRLSYFDLAKELIEFYENEIHLFIKIQNPHNVCQILLALATLQEYNPSIWMQLMDRLEGINFESDKSCFNRYFISSAFYFIKLAEKESPKTYNEFLKDSALNDFVQKNIDFCVRDIHESRWQSIISNTIREMGHEVIDEHKIDQNSFDMYLPEKNLIIEFNGPSHYLNGTKIRIKGDSYRHRLLDTDKYDMVYIPYQDVMKFFKNPEFHYEYDDHKAMYEGAEFSSMEEYLKDMIENVDKYKVTS